MVAGSLFAFSKIACGASQQPLVQYASVVQGKKTHRHKQNFGIVAGLVLWQNLFMCFFVQVSPYGGGKHINKIPAIIPGKSCEILVYVSFYLYVFRSQVLRFCAAVARFRHSDERLTQESLSIQVALHGGPS